MGLTMDESDINSCPKCGFENNHDAVECQRCGIIFTKYEMVQRRKLEEKPKHTPPPLIKNTNKVSETAYIIIALALVGIGLFIIVAIALGGRSIDLPLWIGGMFVTVSIPFTVYRRHFKRPEKQSDPTSPKPDKQNDFVKPKPILESTKKNTISPPVRSHPNKQEKIRIINRDETTSAILFTIHIQVDKFDSHKLFCEIDKKGSPWVTVDATHFDEPGEKFQYNARHARWKDRFETPFWIEKGLQTATQLIRNEWNAARRRYGWELETRKRKLVTADISTEKVVFTYDQEQLAKLDDHIEVQGSGRELYQINLQQLSCTCPDFKKRRAYFPEGDIRRVCKHQAQAIIGLRKNMKITDDMRIQNIIRGSQDMGFHVFDQCIEVTFNESVRGPNPFYIFIEPNNDWINVVSFSLRSFTRAGYNTIEKRWAYGSSPFPAGYKQKYDKAIEKAINSI